MTESILKKKKFVRDLATVGAVLVFLLVVGTVAMTAVPDVSVAYDMTTTIQG